MIKSNRRKFKRMLYNLASTIPLNEDLYNSIQKRMIKELKSSDMNFKEAYIKGIPFNKLQGDIRAVFKRSLNERIG